MTEMDDRTPKNLVDDLMREETRLVLGFIGRLIWCPGGGLVPGRFG
jgi:hypothetical protein